jgi:hypothetical protein
MKRILAVAFVLNCLAGRAFTAPSEVQNLELVNRVQARVAAGDTDALNDLTTLPANDSCPALFAIFKKNRNDAVVRSKCAQLAVTVPGGEEFILKLLKRRAADNPEFSWQEIAIRCLVLNHTKTSVRILGSTLDDIDLEELGPNVIRALAELNPPASPIMPTNHAVDAEALAEWKRWWAANNGNYTVEAARK